MLWLYKSYVIFSLSSFPTKVIFVITNRYSGEILIVRLPIHFFLNRIYLSKLSLQVLIQREKG